MKRLIPFLIFIFFVLVASGQQIHEPYDYPVRPETVNWSQFKSRDEKAKALLIPDSILTKLTTRALAISCLNFPMFKDLYFFNDVQTGFNTLRLSFNGFNELLERKDASYELLQLYKDMEPSKFDPSWSEIQKGDFVFGFVAIEILLAQDDILDNLPNDLIEEALLEEAFAKYQKKKTVVEFSVFGTSPSVLIIGRLLDKEGKLGEAKNNNRIAAFLALGIVEDPVIMDRIISLYIEKTD